MIQIWNKIYILDWKIKYKYINEILNNNKNDKSTKLLQKIKT